MIITPQIAAATSANLSNARMRQKNKHKNECNHAIADKKLRQKYNRLYKKYMADFEIKPKFFD